MTVYASICGYKIFWQNVLDLPIKGPLEDAGVTKLYEPSPTPCLYVAPAANMAGRVPLIPLFLAGNSTPTIPHMFKRKDSGFPYGCADAGAADGRRGSNVYEVNLWLWSFARGKPRLGGLSVEKTFERQVAANEASKERAAENRRRRKADKAWFKVKEVFDSICTQYILIYTNIYAVYDVTSLRYTLIYPLFASHCLNSDLSNSDSGKPCNVFGMCFQSDPSILDFPKSKEK